MWVVIPARIEFRRDDMRHPKAVADALMRTNPVSMTGTFKARIGPDRQECLDVLIKDVEDYLVQEILSSSTLLTDFRLIYATAEVKDGKFWASVSVVGHVRLGGQQ